MKRISHVLLAALLGACGGGGGGAEAPGSSPPPGTSFVLNVELTGLSGGAVQLADGQGRAVTLSSNGRHRLSELPEGSAYGVAVVQQPSTQVCEIERSSGILTAERAVSVKCTDGLTLPMGETYSVAQVASVFVPGNPETVTATLDGQPLTLLRTGGTFVFLVPDVVPGTHAISVSAAGRTFQRSLSITANPLAEDPVTYLTRRVASTLSQVEADLADATLLPDQRVFLEQLRRGLASWSAAAMTSAQTLQQARILAANELAAARDPAVGPLSRARPFGAACDALRTQLVVGSAATVFSAGLAAFGFAAWETGVGAVVAGVGLYGAYKGFKYVLRLYQRITTECVYAKEVDAFAPGADDLAIRGRSAIIQRARPMHDRGLHVQHGAALVMTPRLRVRLDDQITDELLSRLKWIAAQYEQLRSVFTSFAALPAEPGFATFPDLTREKTRVVPMSELVVETGSPAVSVTSVAADRELRATFRFTAQPLPTAEQRFTFTVRHVPSGVSSEPRPAYLTPPQRPQSIAGSVWMHQDGAVRDVLQATGAVAFEVTEQPQHGTVVLVDAATGEFIYTPQAGFVGEDIFTYTGSNDIDVSTPATMVMHVEVACNGEQAAGTSVSYACMKTLPMRLVHQAPTGVEFFDSLMPPSLFGGTGEYLSHLESASLDAGHAALSPSGTALVLYTTDGLHDAGDGSFTELHTSGTFDAASNRPIAHTEVQRRRLRHVMHPQGGRYVVAEAAYAYVWFDGDAQEARPAFLTLVNVQLAGYGTDGAVSYTAVRTDCILGATPAGDRVWAGSVGSDGSVATGPEQSGPCPAAAANVDAVAPEVTPATLRIDWQTGQVRPSAALRRSVGTR